MTMQDKKTWSGRFNEPVAELVKRYTASVEFDQRLAPFDIQGSLAHAQMLASCGIISAQDLTDIKRGMAQIENEIISGKFVWSLDLEDVHLNIEKRLTTLVSMPVSVCTPGVRATIRWPPMCACICAMP